MADLSNSTFTSRRRFLAAGPVASVFGALGVAKAAEVVAPSAMAMLGVEFERLWAIERHADALTVAYDEFKGVTQAVSEIVQRILVVPAKTLDDFKVKARALSWCWGSADEFLSGFFEDMDSQDTTDTKLVKSIFRDLFAA